MPTIFIDHEAEEIIHVVASVHLSVHYQYSNIKIPLSRLNRLTYELDFLPGSRPWPWLGWDCRSRSKFKVIGLWIVFWYDILLSFNRFWGRGQRLSSRCHFLMARSGQQWYLAQSPMKHKSGTLIIECSSQGAFKMVVYVICCFDRLGVCGRART